jgi:hypothetical protein
MKVYRGVDVCEVLSECEGENYRHEYGIIILHEHIARCLFPFIPDPPDFCGLL